MKLFYAVLGCTPKGRHIEQHDVFFGIAEDIKDLVPYFKAFWPEAAGKIHLDAYVEVKFVDGYLVKITEKPSQQNVPQLFFINLGGYKPGAADEFHHKMLVVSDKLSGAVSKAKKSEFYKQMSFPGANSHVDEKYGVDVDDIYNVYDLLPADMKAKYAIHLEESNDEMQENPTKIGYFQLNKL